MKRNITLRLDEDLLREAKVLAANLDTSVSRLLAEMIEARIKNEKGYARARRRALRRLHRGYDLGWRPLARDELHER